MNTLDRTLAEMREQAHAPALKDAMDALARWDDPARHTIGAALTERDRLRGLLLDCRVTMSGSKNRRMVALVAQIDWELAGD